MTAPAPDKNPRTLIAAVVAGLVVLMVITLLVASAGFRSRFQQDFWPIDASRVAPNILASVVQWVILALAVYALYPPFRRAMNAWVHGHFHRHQEHMKAHHAERDRQAAEHRESLAQAHTDHLTRLEESLRRIEARLPDA